MPQFDFFATWDDDWPLLDALFLAMEINVIPDKWYRSREIDIFQKTDSALRKHIATQRRVFVYAKSTQINTTAGLERQDSGPKAGHYSIESDSIGEVLELTFPACFEEDGVICLGSGSLTHPNEYFNHKMGIWQAPSKALICFYNEVRTVLKHNLSSVSFGKSKAWVGQHALRLLNSGKARITDLGVV